MNGKFENTAELPENVIEYWPEYAKLPDRYDAVEATQVGDLALDTIYVCSLCCREYSLVEDLRGHFIEFHQLEPIHGRSKSASRTFLEYELGVPGSDCPSSHTADAPSAAEKRHIEAEEMPPMPFKDFRLVLRSKLTLRCLVSYGCAYKFEAAAQAEQHAKCHLPESQHFKCYECDTAFDNWRRCSEHLWKAHEIDVDMLRCPACDFKAHTSVHVWRHMRVHSRWRPRVMRTLNAVKQKQKLSKQMNREAGPSPSQEPEPTPASTAVPPTHTPPSGQACKNKYYSEKTCEICDRKFVNGKTLSKHVKTVHNKIKPFICNVCGLKTARKASLTVHMRQHTGEKPLQCRTCKFATRDPSVLHKHQLRHEKGGKFKCTVCNYACIQTNAYKRHMRLKHPDEYKRIACDICAYVTISEERLLAHKEDHRKGLISNCEDSLDATRTGRFKYPRKLHDKLNDISADCFMPLESIDSLPHEPAVDTGGVTIPAPPSEDTQFPHLFE